MKKKSKHGMTTEQARRVKILGHTNENIVAEKIGGQVLGGRVKGDVRDAKNEILSVKTGKKTQWALYCKTTMINSDWNEKQRKSIEDYIDFLPDSKWDYERDTHKYKKNPFAQNLYKVFNDDPMKLIRFFCGFGKVDAFHLTDIRDNKTYQVPSNIFFDKIEKSIQRIYVTPGGKFVIA
jgi:hypothetical protein